MHLISLPASPFAARVRIAIYAKDLDVEIVPPPAGWPHNPQFRDIAPTGRVPVLLLENGDAVWESAVISELLEDLFPRARALLPAEALLRAKARLLARHADLYLMPPMIALARPHARSEEAHYVEQLVDGLAELDLLLAGAAYAVDHQLTHADCALAPILFAARVTGERLGIDLIKATPNIQAYAAFVREDVFVGRVLTEMDDGLRLFIRDV